MLLKPLYLEGRETAVELDGPALKVMRPRHADRWFPLRRVQRVVTARCVQWTLEALLACAETGVGVHFLDYDGTVVARWIGAGRAEPVKLGVPVENLLLHPDGLARYQDWLDSMTRIAIRSVLKRSGLAHWLPASPTALHRMFFDAARDMGQEAGYRRIGALARSALTSRVMQFWLDAGLDIEGTRAQGLDLCEDFTTILFWDFELARLKWLEERLQADRANEPPLEAEVFAFYERRRERVDHLLSRLALRFQRWLIEGDYGGN